eukprot:7531972-Alexandrium_andersonii.AAC.1
MDHSNRSPTLCLVRSATFASWARQGGGPGQPEGSPTLEFENLASGAPPMPMHPMRGTEAHAKHNSTGQPLSVQHNDIDMQHRRLRKKAMNCCTVL